MAAADVPATALPAARAAGAKPGANAVHRTALDGIRAFAIGAVMLVHAGAPGARSGWVGVDLFFVLSGFLITTLLAMEMRATGGVAWVPFMARRALRLMPAYFLYAAFVTWCIWGWGGSMRSTSGPWTAAGLTAALWTYTINFAPQGGIWNGQDLTVHLWSLAVEQQYYLFWPLVIIALARWPRALRFVAVGLAAAFIALFIAQAPGLAMLWTRGFSLVLASALALWAAHDASFLEWRALQRGVDAAGVVLLAALTVLPYCPGWTDNATRTLLIPMLVPVFAMWVGRLWYVRGGGAMRALLQDRRLVYVGKVSYGIYLYHEAVRVGVWYWLKPHMDGWPQSIGFVTRFVIYAAISFVLAALSYELVEKQFLRYADRFRPRRAATGA